MLKQFGVSSSEMCLSGRDMHMWFLLNTVTEEVRITNVFSEMKY